MTPNYGKNAKKWPFFIKILFLSAFFLRMSKIFTNFVPKITQRRSHVSIQIFSTE